MVLVLELELYLVNREQIAIKASNENSDEINIIESRTKPTWLPPQPFLNIGVKTRLMFERFRSRSDV